MEKKVVAVGKIEVRKNIPPKQTVSVDASALLFDLAVSFGRAQAEIVRAMPKDFKQI